MIQKKQIPKIRSVSAFKNQEQANHFFKEWINWLSELTDTEYERMDVESYLGTTVVWGINAGRTDLETIVIFPGFRTCSLFWDMDNSLEPLKKNYRIFLVDTNGQPCLSEGKTPDIKSNDYGIWAAGVLEKLSVKKAIIAGASFGALVCLKLCIVAPHLVEKAVLLNPGCLQSFSLSFKNLYYNFLPLISPRRGNIEKFLDKAIFYKDMHTVSPAVRRLIIDYELFAITHFKDRAQKPYAMSRKELGSIKTDVFLVLGDQDILFPYRKSIAAARKHIRTLRSIHIVPETGHGIETSKKAINILAGIAAGEPIYQSEPANLVPIDQTEQFHLLNAAFLWSNRKPTNEKIKFMEVIFAIPLLFIPLIMPWLAGQMAKSFGRKFRPWFLVGILLPFVANIILLCLPDKSKKKKEQMAEAVENEDIFNHLFENENLKHLKNHEAHFSKRA